MFEIFYFFTLIIIIICDVNETKKILEYGKLSACMVLSQEIIKEKNIPNNSSEIYEGLANCFYKITDMDFSYIMRSFKKGKRSFKDSSLIKLVNAQQFNEENSKEDKLSKLIEVQKVLKSLQDRQKGIIRNDSENESSFDLLKNLTKKNNSKLFDTKAYIEEMLKEKLKNISKKFEKNQTNKENIFDNQNEKKGNNNNTFFNYFYLFLQYVFNQYVIVGLLIIFGFYVLRFLKQKCKKNKEDQLKKNNKKKK